MHKSGWIWIGIALLAVVFTSGSALADNRAGAFTLTPQAGWHFFEGDQNVDDDWTLGLGFGYNYTENWGTELMLNYTDASPDNGGPGLETWTLTLNGLYSFLPDSPFNPYLQAGIGANHNNWTPGSSRENFLLNYGLGVKYFLTQNLALRLDGRHFMAFREGLEEWSETDNNVLLTAGLTFQFGGAQPAAQPEPVREQVREPVRQPVREPAPAPAAAQDSDGDGVLDDQDQCPDTEAGVMVDEQGCPLSMNIHVEFDFDKAEIKPEHRNELEKAAKFIQEHDSPKILIAGHTDSIGTAAYNRDLSHRRAAAVRQYLLDNYDIDADRLVSRGYGESRPIASNDTPEGRQENRRTEIVCCVFIPQE